VRGKGTKLGEHCPKVRLSQDRMPIEPFRIMGFLYVFGIFTSFGIVTYGTITWCPDCIIGPVCNILQIVVSVVFISFFGIVANIF
jgi:hypothetical protein